MKYFLTTKNTFLVFKVSAEKNHSTTVRGSACLQSLRNATRINAGSMTISVTVCGSKHTGIRPYCSHNHIIYTAWKHPIAPVGGPFQVLGDPSAPPASPASNRITPSPTVKNDMFQYVRRTSIIFNSGLLLTTLPIIMFNKKYLFYLFPPLDCFFFYGNLFSAILCGNLSLFIVGCSTAKNTYP
jgi:hypothetical protein